MSKANKLNPKEEMFCHVYTDLFFGNMTKSYIKAYNVKVPLDVPYLSYSESEQKKYNTASTLSTRLLQKVKIKKRINELLDKLFTNETVDRETVKVIMQNKNLPSKMKAIAEHNKIKQRIVHQVEDVTPSRVDKNSKKYKTFLDWRKKQK